MDHKNRKRRELEASRLTYAAAAERLDGLRRQYDLDLLQFTEDKRRGVEVGTRTEFDLSHYWMKGKASHDYAAAQAQHQYNIVQAAKIGALSVGERVRLFGDEEEPTRADGGSVGEAVDRLMDELMEEQVQRWLEDRGQEEIVSERHWPRMLDDGAEDAPSLDGLSALERREALAPDTNERRKQIDAWTREQERTRRKHRSEFPCGPLKEIELQWFEGWNGL